LPSRNLADSIGSGRKTIRGSRDAFLARAADEPDYRICREDFLRFNGMEPAPA